MHFLTNCNLHLIVKIKIVNLAAMLNNTKIKIMATKKVTAVKSTVKKTAAKPKAAATKKTTTTKAKPEITVEDIRKKAELIYNARLASGEEGSPESDWLKAEASFKTAKKK